MSASQSHGRVEDRQDMEEETKSAALRGRGTEFLFGEVTPPVVRAVDGRDERGDGYNERLLPAAGRRGEMLGAWAVTVGKSGGHGMHF